MAQISLKRRSEWKRWRTENVGVHLTRWTTETKRSACFHTPPQKPTNGRLPLRSVLKEHPTCFVTSNPAILYSFNFLGVLQVRVRRGHEGNSDLGL